ncbi:hypothetical protein KCU91_g2, partial [Aureobasidium melanogenum]
LIRHQWPLVLQIFEDRPDDQNIPLPQAIETSLLCSIISSESRHTSHIRRNKTALHTRNFLQNIMKSIVIAAVITTLVAAVPPPPGSSDQPATGLTVATSHKERPCYRQCKHHCLKVYSYGAAYIPSYCAIRRLALQTQMQERM